MEGILHDNNAGVLAELDEPNIAQWVQTHAQQEENKAGMTSLTKIDGLDGADEKDVYGAQFQNVEGVLHTPFYDRVITQKVKVPWLAEPQEATYMNRTKELNEEPYKSYRELRYQAIPAENNSFINPEFFGPGKEWIFKLLSLALIIVAVYFIITKLRSQ